jgi:hypothetical protein
MQGVVFLGMNLFVLFQILRSFEGFLADDTSMRFQRRVDWIETNRTTRYVSSHARHYGL